MKTNSIYEIDGVGEISLFTSYTNNLTLLCIHGYQGSNDDFSGLFPLSGTLSLIIPDLPGHGRSLKRGITFSVESIADVLGRLLDHHNAERVVILAHSIGGAIGVRLATKNTGRLVGFINCEGNLISSDCGMVTKSVAELPDGVAYQQTEGFMRFKETVPDACADSLVALKKSVYQESCSGELLEAYQFAAGAEAVCLR